MSDKKQTVDNQPDRYQRFVWLPGDLKFGGFVPVESKRDEQKQTKRDVQQEQVKD